MWKTFKPFLKPYRKQLILGPFFKLLEAVFELLLPIYLAKLIDNGLVKHNLPTVWHNTLIILILSLIGLGCVIICQYFASIASQGVGTTLRNQCLTKIQNLTNHEQQRLGTNKLITYMTSDINQCQQAVAMLIRLVIRAPFLSLGAVFMAFTIKPLFGWIFVAILPCFIMLLAYIMRKTVPIYQQTQQITDNLNQVINDNLSGQPIIRTFNQTKAMLHKFQQTNTKYTKTAIKAGYVASILQPGTVLMVNIGISIILVLSVHLVAHQQILPGQLLALITYMSQMLLALIVIANLVTLFTKALASAKRLEQLLNLPQQANHSLEVLPSDLKLTLQDVTYQYPNSELPAIQNVNYQIKPQMTLGITGPTGSGKTTLLNLIQGFLTPTIGQIITNTGQNLQDYSQQQLAEALTITTQKPILFKGTIRSNLQWGKNNLTDEEAWQVLDDVCLATEIKQWPDQLDTPVETLGHNLSGGQRQRLALARALLKPTTQILLLDDFFTALDSKTSQTILANLQNHYPHLTKIFVTQQLAILKQVDDIILLEDGRITAHGNHETLKAKSSLYQLLCTMQEKE